MKFNILPVDITLKLHFIKKLFHKNSETMLKDTSFVRFVAARDATSGSKRVNFCKDFIKF